MERHLAVAVFVIAEEHVVLLHHKKLGKWLPPGGHIEKNELPDEAAIREVKEETGLDCKLVGNKALKTMNPQQLIVPLGIQLEDIDAKHQHIDLVYKATTIDGKMKRLSRNKESSNIGWFDHKTILNLPLGQEMLLWIDKVLPIKRTTHKAYYPQGI